MSKRIYTEEEVARLIRRAVELEAERSVSGEDRKHAGLSIAELEEVAAESGIDPELIQKAAAELETVSPSRQETVHREKAKVKSSEIVCERWIDGEPDRLMMDELITELNHKFGTSEDDINWWNELWNDYAGKAKIRKTSRSVEWEYTNELESHTIRILLQKRTGRFRIRVSKRQNWGLNWGKEGGISWVFTHLFIPYMITGGVLGAIFMSSFWTGVVAGGALGLLSYPFAVMYGKRYLNKHRQQVTELADDLADYTLQLMSESSSDRIKREEGRAVIIEIDDRNEEDQKERNEGLRNLLR